jgi:hypothetical protein
MGLKPVQASKAYKQIVTIGEQAATSSQLQWSVVAAGSQIALMRARRFVAVVIPAGSTCYFGIKVGDGCTSKLMCFYCCCCCCYCCQQPSGLLPAADPF